MQKARLILAGTMIAFIMSFFLAEIKKHPESEAKEEEKVASINPIYQFITQVSDWLNVSRTITPKDLESRVILLDFWTFCCINCMHVIPDLHYLEEKFGDALTVIGVHSAKFLNEKDSDNIRAAIQRYNIEHPVVNDAEFKIWRSFGVRAWPTLVLINPKGKVESVYSGEGHRADLEEEIGNLIDSYGTALNTTPLPIALEKTKTAVSVLKFPGKIIYVREWQGVPALFISDSGHNRILGVRIDGSVFLSIGSKNPGLNDGNFEEAQFNNPQGLLYKEGILYVADTNNHALRQIDLKSQQVTTIAGTGEQGYERRALKANALKTSLASPWDLVFFPSDKFITIAMAGTHQLWTYDITNKTVSVLAGNGRESIDDGSYPYNSLSQPSGLSVAGDTLYFVDSETSSLRKLTENSIETLIGTGLFDFGLKDGGEKVALMQHPLGLFADEKNIYIADSYNHAIRTYDVAYKTLSTLSGNGKAGTLEDEITQSQFNEPNDIEKVGNLLYITDTNNHAIRIINLAEGKVSTLPIIEKLAPSFQTEPTPKDLLPNLIENNPAVYPAAGKPLTFEIGLDKNWKINDEAPSFLTLYKKEGSAWKSTNQYGANDLRKKRISLGDLTANTPYLLQGTFYYCENKPQALCLIRSYSQDFTPEVNNKDTVIKIALTSANE